ncbi:undecaprenyl-diphosphate phosphatase [Oceanisphaera pacifica]|uniref:Undecaprenyl-diphosphatase n=1 Tax=Oceanisphaera pacifica TaxID=2818389 RepID=A0ABS3NCA1_9GAMM|nr:undecaprenyl-diphosphate phosphatase [Oceanisphaera pacifica]MBO1518229.1 undecaprenyl-diphosphate phosphatase [Oceanisphaera pacifica]
MEVHAILLALIQGFTEFLPISSSAHLILPSVLLGWEDQGMAFDVAVHLGSLLAVVYYFRKEVASLAVAWLSSISGKAQNAESKLAWCIILATIPACIVGVLFGSFIADFLRSGWVIAVATIVFGLLLWRADKVAQHYKGEYQTGWRGALWLGCAQALALIPGTSRSGITLTAGLMIGMTRDAAARFSFLMSIPIIFLAGSHQATGLLTAGATIPWGAIGLGVIVSFVSALACIHLFLTLINRIGIMPFVWYRLGLGAVLFVVLSGQM